MYAKPVSATQIEEKGRELGESHYHGLGDGGNASDNKKARSS
jgi:hypothetical protein